MKKIVILFTVILLALISCIPAPVRAQNPFIGYSYATITTQFGRTIPAGRYIVIQNTGSIYYLTKQALPNQTMSSLINSGQVVGGYHPLVAGGSTGLYIDTSSAQNIWAVKTFWSAPTIYGSPLIKVGSTRTNLAFASGGGGGLGNITTGGNNVFVLGGDALTTGSSNTNCGQGSFVGITTNSNNTGLGAFVFDYLQAPGDENLGAGFHAGYGILHGSDNIVLGPNAGPTGTTTTVSNMLCISNKVGCKDTALIYGDMEAARDSSYVQINGTLMGQTNLRGTGAFSGGLTRAGIKIPGARVGDVYTVTAKGVDAYTRPVAGDQLNCFAKTDSLIVMRQAGTTSGLSFYYHRIR